MPRAAAESGNAGGKGDGAGCSTHAQLKQFTMSMVQCPHPGPAAVDPFVLSVFFMHTDSASVTKYQLHLSFLRPCTQPRSAESNGCRKEASGQENYHKKLYILHMGQVRSHCQIFKLFN